MISAVILAAGKSARMGEMKLLLPLGARSMIQTVTYNVLGSKAEEVVIVVGNDADRVRSEIESLAAGLGIIKSRLKIVENPDFAEGQSTSVRIGISAVNAQSEGALILMGDQPFVGAELIDTFIDRFFAEHTLLVVPQYPEGHASPVLFARSLFPELMAVTGDKGGREIVKKYLEGQQRNKVSKILIHSDITGLDIDTREEYERLRVQMMP